MDRLDFDNSPLKAVVLVICPILIYIIYLSISPCIPTKDRKLILVTSICTDP